MIRLKMALLAAGLLITAGAAGLGWLNLPEFPAAVQAAGGHVFTVDVAVDCRTFVGGSNRGDLFMLNGKIFPAGTLPSGPASNEPGRPFNGVAPIGDFLVRGQHAFPFPPEVAAFYSSLPVDFATQYYVFEGGRSALTMEGYAFVADQTPTVALLALTGGIGAYSGAAGDVRGTLLGTNASQCPNFRVNIYLQPGSVRGNSNR
jgi:hypothetical protein